MVLSLSDWLYAAAVTVSIFLLGAIPWIGGLLTATVVLMATGVCASTRSISAFIERGGP